MSEDLVYWTDLPVALEPTLGGPDEDGCYSGCAFDNHGIPTLIYTGVQGEKQLPCLAESSDGELVTWKKYEGNPVIPSPPERLETTGFRDHCVWKEDGTWYQVIGSGVRGVGGAVLLYRSWDLINWEYMHPLYVGDETCTNPVWTGSMWECPDFFALGDKHVLIVSVFDSESPHYTVYFIGSYVDHRFVPEKLEVIDPGGYFYAPQTLLDEKGRRIMWGWVWEGRDESAALEAGWAGVLSLPRVLSMRPDGKLGMEPVSELRGLRGEHYGFANIDLTPDSFDAFKGVQGDCLEIVAEFEIQDAECLGLKVHCSPGGEEETLIVYDNERKRLGLDTTRSSLGAGVHRDARWSSLTLHPGETLRLHIFIDRSVIEVFANHQTCITGRTYPSLPESSGLDLFSLRGNAKLKSLDLWEMSPIWTAPTAPDSEVTG